MWIIWLVIFILVVIGKILQDREGNNNQAGPPPSALFSLAGDLINAFPAVADLGVEDLISSLPAVLDFGPADLLLGLAL